jgi:hypothetical protein
VRSVTVAGGERYARRLLTRGRGTLAGLVALTGLGAMLALLLALHPPRPAAAPAPPGSLELVGKDPLMGRGMNAALAVHGRYAYVGSRTDGSHPNAGVLVVDVRDPQNPHVVGQIGQPTEDNPGESSRELRVWPEQDLLIVMNFACDDVGHACAGSAAGDVDATFRFYDLHGDHAANPKLVATYRPSHNPHEFFLWRDPRRPADRAFLYVTTPFKSGAELDKDAPDLIVTDISGARSGKFREVTKWTPEREKKYEAAALHSLSVSSDGRRAYLADLEGGFEVADTSRIADGVPKPTIPQLTPAGKSVHHEIPGAHSALQLGDRPYALITDEVYGRGFGAGPFIGFNVLKGCPWGWARTVDIHDPAKPRLVGEYKVSPYNDSSRCSSFSATQENGASFSSHNPTVTRDVAVITWHSAGLQVAAVSNPAHPEQLAQYRPDPLSAVATEDPALSAGTEKVVMWSYPIVRGGLIYAVDIRNGLYILRYRGPYATELGCYSYLEGNSSPARQVPRCGLRLRLAARARKRHRRCRRKRRQATLRGEDLGRVRSVEFQLAGRRVASDGRAPFTRWLPRRSGRLTALVILDDGSRVSVPRSPRRKAHRKARRHRKVRARRSRRRLSGC